MFNKKILNLLIIFLSAAHFSYALIPQNIDIQKKKLIEYHDSGEYQKDQEMVVKQARQYLEERLKTPSDKQLAIVLDIDETSLSNYSDMKLLNFGGTNQEIDDAEGKAQDEVIKPTLELYQYAKEHNVAVFFVTGRREHYRVPTVENLLKAGYKNWDGLILKPESYNQKSAAPYKIQARQLIAKKGYDIVLSMGDQESDLMGGYADKTFKLPNPYYLIP